MQSSLSGSRIDENGAPRRTPRLDCLSDRPGYCVAQEDWISLIDHQAARAEVTTILTALTICSLKWMVVMPAAPLEFANAVELNVVPSVEP